MKRNRLNYIEAESGLGFPRLEKLNVKTALPALTLCSEPYICGFFKINAI